MTFPYRNIIPVGDSVQNMEHADLLAEEFDIDIHRLSMAGAGAAEQGDFLYNNAGLFVPKGRRPILVTYSAILNDGLNGGPANGMTPGRMQNWREMTFANLANIMIQNRNTRFIAQDPNNAACFSGTDWSASTDYPVVDRLTQAILAPGTTSMCTDVVGAKINFKFHGETLYINRTMRDGWGGRFTFRSDGVLKGTTYDCFGAAGSNIWNNLVRHYGSGAVPAFRNLGSGMHDGEIEVVAGLYGDSRDIVQIDSWMTPGRNWFTNGVRLFAGGCTPQRFDAPAANAEPLLAYTDMLEEIVEEQRGDGLPVFFGRVGDSVNPYTDFFPAPHADITHPYLGQKNLYMSWRDLVLSHPG